jgi:hypothetical protein
VPLDAFVADLRRRSESRELWPYADTGDGLGADTGAA